MSDEDRIEEQPSEDEPEEPEATRKPEASAEEVPPEPQAEESEAEAGYTPPPPEDINVFDLLRAVIPMFVQEAWVALGVQARPGATDVHTDLRCARVAIDTTQALVEKLGDEATAEERREFDQVLTTLRVNFVRRQAKLKG